MFRKVAIDVTVLRGKAVPV